MKSVFFLLLMVAMVSFNTSCQAQESQNSKSENTVVAEKAAPGTLKHITVEEFKSMIAANSEIQVVDVRTPGEWAQGTLADAQTINVNDANFMEKAKTLDKNAPVAVYCKMGGRSTRAGNMLVKEGFEEVYNMTGGITAWQNAGFEVKK